MDYWFFCLAHLRTSKTLRPPLFVGTKNQNYSMISHQAEPTLGSYNFLVTVWQEIFVGVYFCRLVIFCVLRELIFAIKTDWFFLLGINFCDFQKVPSTQH